MEVRSWSQADLPILSLAALQHLQSLTFLNALAAGESSASAMQELSKTLALELSRSCV